MNSSLSKFKKMYIAGSNPHRDWHRLVSMLLVFLVICGVWSLLFYFQVASDVVPDTTVDSTQVSISESLQGKLRDLIDVYGNKTAEFDQLSGVGSSAAPGGASSTATTTAASSTSR